MSKLIFAEEESASIIRSLHSLAGSMSELHEQYQSLLADRLKDAKSKDLSDKAYDATVCALGSLGESLDSLRETLRFATGAKPSISVAKKPLPTQSDDD